MVKRFLIFLIAVTVIASLVIITGCKGKPKEEAQTPAKVEQPSQSEEKAPEATSEEKTPEATEEGVPEKGSPETQPEQKPAQPGEKL